MQASAVLRGCMIGLVLLNLVFVQLTEATGIEWLVPLYVLTLTAPLLARFRTHVLYRVAWNVGVLSVFALLVRHATGEDLRYVLEDGLVLAVLCQVHLINNLRSEQRPDLLFLNAFLIAIITGYLARDLAFFAAFLVFVPLFIVGLELWCVALGSSAPSSAATRPIVVDGLRRSAVLLAATVLVFLFWPRDFERRGLVVTDFDFASSSGDSEVRFNDELKLQSGGSVKASDRVVLTVEIEHGSAGSVPSLWRGAILTTTNGVEWWPRSGQDLSIEGLGRDAWYEDGATLRRAGSSLDPASYVRVEHVDPEANYLFAPLAAETVTYGRGIEAHRIQLLPGGIIRYGVPNLVRPDLSYHLALPSDFPSRAGRVDEHDEQVAPLTAVPLNQKTAAALRIASDLMQDRPDTDEQHELVQRFRDHLAASYAYLPPGAEGAASSLDEFLAGGAGGHCEFFASALATMLRLVGVPCRLATGYRSREWDDRGRVLTFRRRDAHAWVEVLDPAGGWYPVDPTPAASFPIEASLWRVLEDRIGAFWAQLSGFDEEGRSAAFAWLARAPGRLVEEVRERPLRAVGWGGLVTAALVGFALRRRRRVPASLRRFHRAERRAGLRLRGGETPRELCARARREGCRGDRVAELERATREHERARYSASRRASPAGVRPGAVARNVAPSRASGS